ncbi:hypothetical protein D039_0796A, partial [Vibrio parahaemolyticus EKP-028]
MNISVATSTFFTTI